MRRIAVLAEAEGIKSVSTPAETDCVPPKSNVPNALPAPVVLVPEVPPFRADEL
jgi:hypothetical protein